MNFYFTQVLHNNDVEKSPKQVSSSKWIQIDSISQLQEISNAKPAMSLTMSQLFSGPLALALYPSQLTTYINCSQISEKIHKQINCCHCTTTRED